MAKELKKDEQDIRKLIEEYYLPRQLIDSIFELGEIPKSSVETVIAIGFIDLADYSYLSKFLSPKENQIVLNGLYTAFQSVLNRRGGYLNKIEGDALMFHFGGPIDPIVRKLKQEKQIEHMAKELFYTCVELQRVCHLFNQANDRFLEAGEEKENSDALQGAFKIIESMRTKGDLAKSFNAFFQIRIRVGAHIGEVIMGNFGPSGARQWDIIGMPVIAAKRMEMTAPVGGLRISAEFYDILDRYGIIDTYYSRFKREAELMSSVYQHISKEDLFSFSKVLIREKRGVQFETYSVQVNPALPEHIAEQVETLLQHSEPGVERIQELMKYYRGNKYVIGRIEKLLDDKGIKIRKDLLLEHLFPKKYKELSKQYGSDVKGFIKHIEENYNLFSLFEKLGQYQDIIKQEPELERSDEPFLSFESTMIEETKQIKAQYEKKKQYMIQRAYFYNVVYPLVFANIKNAILEFQNITLEVEELEEIPL